MIVLIDNYDSFTYNLVQMLMGRGGDIHVVRNDAVTVDDIEAMAPEGLIVSPGPCTPNEAGISVEAIRRFSGRIPLFGVCLGHQSIGVAFGATVSNAQRIMHGKVSPTTYEDSPMYRGMPQPFQAGRYHSLAIIRDTVPDELIVDAVSDDGEIMGVHHRTHPTYGVQFHPESVLSPDGGILLTNFLELVAGHAS